MAKNEHGLTPQQEKFAQGVGAGLSQAESYRQAYPLSRKWKPETVHQTASRLAADRNVVARVSTIQAAGADRAELDVAEIMREIHRVGTTPERKAVCWQELHARVCASIYLLQHIDCRPEELPERYAEVLREACAYDGIEELETNSTDALH